MKKTDAEKPDTDKPIYGWSWHWPNKGRQIFAYPQMKIGSSPWEPLPKIDDRFPAKIKTLKSLTIFHDLDANFDGEFNVATTMWLVDAPDIGERPNKSIITAEIMIWTFATSGHMNPAGRKIGTIDHNNQNWSVWVSKNWGDASGQNENKWVNVTFKAETPNLSSRYDPLALLRHELLSDLNFEDNYIADVELGTEVMRGQGLVWVNDFRVETTPQ